MPYCKECGSEIKDVSQNFCEKCGSPIPESIKAGTRTSAQTTASQTVSRPPSSSRPGSLFDINRNYYILKEKYWDI